MRITETIRGNVTILTLDGRLDAETAQSLWAQWSTLIERGDRRFVLDLERLSFVSSVGLRVLLMAAKRCSIFACGLTAPLHQTFEISGFAQIIPVRPSVEEAVQAFPDAANAP